MSISSIGSCAAQSIFPWSSSAKSASAATASSGGATASSSGSGGVQTTDFTRMTRKDLFDWINSKIASGEMSFDESSTLVSMTLSFREDGTSSGLDDTQQVDFMQAVRDGMARAQKTSDAELFDRLQAALHTMQRHQGEVRGIDITA